MSQLSQFSDPGPSSLHEGDAIDHLSSYLPSDDIQLFTPDLSCSQQTVTSATESDFLRPLSVPSSLQRVGPDRKKSWVLYADMSKAEFITWWLQTQFGSRLDQQKKIRWDAKRSSPSWKNYDQVAHCVTGEPKIICRRCGKDFPHPHSHSNGTNSMKRHYEANKCQKAASDAAKQQSIHQSMEFAVCI